MAIGCRIGPHLLMTMLHWQDIETISVRIAFVGLLSASNAYIISKMNQAQTELPRFNFMKQLAEDLVNPHFEHLAHQFKLQRELQRSIEY